MSSKTTTRGGTALFAQRLVRNSKTGWNEDRVHELVCDEDVPLVLSTTISSRATHDMIGWHYNMNGIYSVKSAYWLATHLPENDEIVTPSPNVALNNLIWKLQTAPKIKHFLWKVFGAYGEGGPEVMIGDGPEGDRSNRMAKQARRNRALSKRKQSA
ncbi:unnamed protein product [Microthlaspi erraticum]|uniref:Reverse transcriptase zinc-binding domain-containing protein n=1 Tax=Microthlaspi erraticum TaxID=1685480 RepID=A0A6D2KAT0_9BRAS|nr:unnamed protein product [Microthlaspi erraticum]